MKNFEFGARTYIMGILNLTPDSFSGDGIYKDVGYAMERAETLAAEGADMIDIGGESTRPGSLPVSADEEIKRVVPLIQRLAKRIDIPISIDTQKARVAKAGLDAGALIINDISGFEHDSGMASVARDYGAKVILMHMKGVPQTMQDSPRYDNLIEEIKDRLFQLVQNAEKNGVKKDNIIIDPGIGFGKTFENNLEILDNLSCFKAIGKPILIGTSRKSFIGDILGIRPDKRIFGTAASAAIAIKNGADIIRVHDVREMKEVAKVVDAIVRTKEVVNA